MKITDRRTGKKQTLRSLVGASGDTITPFMYDGNLYLYFSGVGNLPHAPNNNFHVLNVTKNRLETVNDGLLVESVRAEVVLTEPSAV